MFIIYWDKFDLHEAWSSIPVGKIQRLNKFPLATFFLSQSTWHEKKERENMSDLSFTRMLHYFINIHLPFFFFPFAFLFRVFRVSFLSPVSDVERNYRHPECSRFSFITEWGTEAPKPNKMTKRTSADLNVPPPPCKVQLYDHFQSYFIFFCFTTLCTRFFLIKWIALMLQRSTPFSRNDSVRDGRFVGICFRHSEVASL